MSSITLNTFKHREKKTDPRFLTNPIVIKNFFWEYTLELGRFGHSALVSD